MQDVLGGLGQAARAAGNAAIPGAGFIGGLGDAVGNAAQRGANAVRGIPGFPGTGGPGGTPPGRDPNAPGPRGEASPATSLEPIGPARRVIPAATIGNPLGWTDPSGYEGTDRLQVEQANALLARIQAAQTKLAANPQDFDAADELEQATNTLRQMGPTLNAIESRQDKKREDERGTLLPGTDPSTKTISVLKRNPDGSYSLQQIPNENAQPSSADITSAASRYGSDVAAGASRYGSDVSRANALTAAQSAGSVAGINAASAGNVANIGAAASRYSTDAGERNAKLNALTQLGTTEMTTTTQRVTAALSAAVEQQRTKIDAAIRTGDLTLRDGTERFNQWYKQNVEAPLAILQQQRETEKYKLDQQNAVTARATGQAEHERGVAQIGTQMWNAASDAYGKMIPLTVGDQWGAGFQRNLTQPGPYQGNTGATYNVSESMDAFATRKVAEMLKGVSPYAANIANSSQQLGANAAPMGGNEMTALQNQATGVASNALANPFQMPGMAPIQMPGNIDIGAMAGIGAGNGNLITGAVNAANQQGQRALPPPPPVPDFSYQSGAGPGLG